jgi:predicted transcriptional regulator
LLDVLEPYIIGSGGGGKGVLFRRGITMILKDILALVNGELLTPEMDLEIECPEVFASDLMSDVLTFINPGSVLLTGLINSHAVRTASLTDVTAIVFVQGKRPDMKVVDEAREKNLPVISTGLSMFEACSRLAQAFPERAR